MIRRKTTITATYTNTSGPTPGPIHAPAEQDVKKKLSSSEYADYTSIDEGGADPEAKGGGGTSADSERVGVGRHSLKSRKNFQEKTNLPYKETNPASPFAYREKLIASNDKWCEAFNEQIQFMMSKGLTDREAAEFFHVYVGTIRAWRTNHTTFDECYQAGKQEANERVVQALFNLAIGYSHEDIVFHTYRGEVIQTPYTKKYPPNVLACIKWLQTKDRANWSDVQSKAINASLNITQCTELTEYTETELMALEKMSVGKMINKIETELE